MLISSYEEWLSDMKIKMSFGDFENNKTEGLGQYFSEPTTHFQGAINAECGRNSTELNAHIGGNN